LGWLGGFPLQALNKKCSTIRKCDKKKSVLDGGNSLFVPSPFPRPMRLLSKILWFLAFLTATFAWMVLFEHGFTVDGFSKGVREEWHALTSMVSGSPRK
jgi:hypothetical protein